MKKLIGVLMLGWSGVAMAQPMPPPVEAPRTAAFNRDDPYLVCAKQHPSDRQRFSNCDLNGVWHPMGQNPS